MVDDLSTRTDTVFRLDLTPPELKIVHTALRALYDGLGHEETDVEDVVRTVLAKLPSDGEIAEIELS